MQPNRTNPRSLAPEGKYFVPVVLHVDDGPSLNLGDIERLIELPDRGLAVVGPFAFCVGVVDEEGEADTAARPGPFEHLQIAVGISESRNRATADMHLDADGFSGLVVVEIKR